jgi:ATP-dependent protease ClpP protease subunit
MKKNPFKYIKNIAEDNSEATILLYKPIGIFKDEETGEMVDGIDGACFAQELLFLATQVDKIHIRINSIGGSVIDGFSIISAIKNSDVTICTYNDGLAASIAGLILIAGDERKAMDYSITMIHNPSGAENNDILEKIKDSLLTILENNSILSLDELDELMNEETYFTSSEAKEAGLIDEIISSEKQVKIETTNVMEMANIFNKIIKESEMKLTTKKSKVKLVEEVKELEIQNKIGIESPETLTNEAKIDDDEETPGEKETDPNESKEDASKEPEDAKVITTSDKIKAHFGFDEDMSDEDMFDALKSFKVKSEDMANENAKLQDKLETLAKEAKQAHKTKIDAMVNSLITSGKITAAEKENVITLANADFEATKNLFSKIGLVTKSVRISDVINKAEAIKTAVWTLEDYWKNDKKGILLSEMKNNTPEIYNQLVLDYNNKKK